RCSTRLLICGDRPINSSDSSRKLQSEFCRFPGLYEFEIRLPSIGSQLVMRHISRIAAMIILVIATAAQPQQQNAQKPKAPLDADWKELTASMEKMHAAAASTHASESSDSNFVKLMLPHHQAAIDMAKAELEYGKDPQMRRLAQEIITDQQSEIEL